MKCQNCGKNNANVSYTRIMNGDKTELHLCSDCAKEMNINVNFNFGLDDMFSNFFDDFARIRSLAMPGFRGLRALENGLDNLMSDSFFESDPFFRVNNVLGTAHDNLDDVLNEIQKKHKEKSGEDKKKMSDAKEEKAEKKENKVEDKKQNEIAQLKAKIQEYIQSEEYEKAAILRDKIKELEK